MFRVKLRVPPERVLEVVERIKTGIRGVGYVRLDDAAAWPERARSAIPGARPGSEAEPARRPEDPESAADPPRSRGRQRRRPEDGGHSRLRLPPMNLPPRRKQSTRGYFERSCRPGSSRRAHGFGPRRLALYGIDSRARRPRLEIPAGCMVGLIGPDGVGKSTLMGLIAGSKQIQTGAVRVLGGDMNDTGHREAVCPRIAYMPQGLGKNLYFELSVFENIDFFARLFGVSDAEREPRIRTCSTPRGWGRSPTGPPASSPAA